MTAVAARANWWVPFLCGLVTGGALVAAVLQVPSLADESGGHSEPAQSGGKEGVPIEVIPDEIWNGTGTLALIVEDTEVECEVRVEGRLQPQDGFGLLKADLSVAEMECGSDEATALVRNDIFRADNHPAISLAVAVGDVERDSVVHQLILLGEGLMVDKVEARQVDEKEIRVAIPFERYLLDLWDPTVGGREVGEMIQLEATLTKVEEKSPND